MLTVVTITRNDRNALAATLGSIASQRCPGEYEVLVVDGASTDGSKAVWDSYADLLPMRVISEADSGIYDAMNKSLMSTRGEYVQWLNAGDTLADVDSLEVLTDALAFRSPLWLTAGAMHLASGQRPPVVIPNRPHRWYRHAWGLQPHCHQACVFQTEACRVLQGYDLSAGLVADFDFILRFGLLQEPVELDAVVVRYQGGGQSAQRWRELPHLLHEVRVRRLGLRGPTAVADRWFTLVQRSKREVPGWH